VASFQDRLLIHHLTRLGLDLKYMLHLTDSDENYVNNFGIISLNLIHSVGFRDEVDGQMDGLNVKNISGVAFARIISLAHVCIYTCIYLYDIYLL
jgi:hypothetical protein